LRSEEKLGGHLELGPGAGGLIVRDAWAQNLSEQKLVCVGFGSGQGSNLEYLLKNAKSFQIPLIFSDQICPIRELCEDYEIEWLYLSGFEACGSRALARSQARLDEYRERCDLFDREILRKLKDFFCQSAMPDFLVLAGYMRILGPTLLEEFKDRVINVHPGDLAWQDPHGVRILRGSKAVLRALACAVSTTYSCVHLVSQEVDAGEILVRSKPCPVEWDRYPGLRNKLLKEWGETNLAKIREARLLEYLRGLKTGRPELYKDLKTLARDHQNKQKQVCDWPALLKAINLLAAGAIELSSQTWEDGSRKIKQGGKDLAPWGLGLS